MRTTFVMTLLAIVFAHGIWLACPLQAMEKAQPVDQIDSDPGARLVERLYASRRGEGRKVPDTLDLQDNALLAIHAITSGMDPDADYRLWFSIYFDRRPMTMRHHLVSEFDQMGKYAEGMTLMRLMTGSKYNEERERKIWEFFDKYSKEDGLLYYDLKSTDPVYTYTQARALLARICRYELKHDPADKARIDRMIDSMLERKMTRGFGFGPLLPACRWYQLTGSKKALELAKLDFDDLSQGIGIHGGQRGIMIIGGDGSFSGQFHYYSGAAIGLLAYGLLTCDDALVEKVRRLYEFARSKGTDYGYFPEGIAVPRNQWVMEISNEGCCTADMACLAAQLSRSGVGDYWDDLDRYLQNQLTEIQMRRTDFTDRIPKENQVPIAISAQRGERELDDMTRFIGVFAGWAAPNDFCGPAHFWIQQCCLGNGPRALYQGWENIVTPSKRGLRINLLLNRSTPEIDVDSYLPYEGKVSINIRKKTQVAVRIPGWVDLSKVKATLNSRKVAPQLNGRYLEFPVLEKGSEVQITFPVKERWVTYRVPGAPWVSKYSITDEHSGSGMGLPASVAATPADIVEKILKPVDYRVLFRGYTIVKIEPGGAIYPLYQRHEMLKQKKAPMRKIKRHMPGKVILNWQ